MPRADPDQLVQLLYRAGSGHGDSELIGLAKHVGGVKSTIFLIGQQVLLTNHGGKLLEQIGGRGRGLDDGGHGVVPRVLFDCGL